MKYLYILKDIESGGTAYIENTAFASYSPLDRHIHVTSSTKNISIKEYCTFHVKFNFALIYFDWIIVSKNIILKFGREYAAYVSEKNAVVITFSVVVSSEMAPGFHLIVYTATSDDYLLSDSAYFPVQGINRHTIDMKLNQIKDPFMNTVEVMCKGEPSAICFTSTVRQFNFATQGKNIITKASVSESMHNFEDDSRHIHRVFWTDREGTRPEQVNYYPSMNYGVDTNRTFDLKELLLFTDFLEIPQTRFTRQCNKAAGQFPCLLKGCYTEEDICNGKKDCKDGLDESNCEDTLMWLKDQTLKFRLSRFNRYVNINTVKFRFNESPSSAFFQSLNRDFTLNQDFLK